jgi:hypothetical protein
MRDTVGHYFTSKGISNSGSKMTIINNLTRQEIKKLETETERLQPKERKVEDQEKKRKTTKYQRTRDLRK